MPAKFTTRRQWYHYYAALSEKTTGVVHRQCLDLALWYFLLDYSEI